MEISQPNPCIEHVPVETLFEDEPVLACAICRLVLRRLGANTGPIEPNWPPEREYKQGDQIGIQTTDGQITWTCIGKFAANQTTITQAGQVVGRMISKTLAKRAANALNRHTPNKEGV